MPWQIVGNIRGADGRDGPAGPAGVGIDGKDGRDGIDGKNGIDGERGLEGPPGRLPLCRSWSDRVYYQGEVCTFAGGTYQAERDTGRRPPDDDWTCLAERGLAGTGFSVRGTHNIDEAYIKGDIAMINGSSFVATRDSPGPCPGDGWQLWASRGSRGERGEAGMRGERGLAGKDAASIVAMTLDDATIMLTLGDGTHHTVDLYPLLMEIRG